jgi:phosphatidylethanolamine-binding protein (PEBP) family uncharacterized protein
MQPSSCSATKFDDARVIGGVPLGAKGLALIVEAPDAPDSAHRR